MKRVKIKFRHLLEPNCGPYSTHIVLEVLNWMLKTGKRYTSKFGWSRYGVDKLLFGYSANNSDSQTNLIGFDIRIAFLNAIIVSVQPEIEQWRKDHKIELDGSFFLKHNESNYINDQCRFIASLANKPLKKEYYQPDYQDRINPFITSIKVFTIGQGITIHYDFTFANCLGSAWTKSELRQQENEGLSDFFDRAVIYFKERIDNG